MSSIKTSRRTDVPSPLLGFLYAFARRHPESARGVMILDSAVPGLYPWPDILGHPAFWHVRFHQTDLPEKLVSGRQAQYFRYFLSQFSDVEVDHYANAYRDPDHLRAAFETYRAFPADEKFFSAQRSRVDLPIVVGSGEHDAFAEFLPHIAAAMRAHGCANLRVETVQGAAHYVAEEKPAAVEKLTSVTLGLIHPSHTSDAMSLQIWITVQ